jgi:hypothetical protein
MRTDAYSPCKRVSYCGIGISNSNGSPLVFSSVPSFLTRTSPVPAFIFVVHATLSIATIFAAVINAGRPRTFAPRMLTLNFRFEYRPYCFLRGIELDPFRISASPPVSAPCHSISVAFQQLFHFLIARLGKVPVPHTDAIKGLRHCGADYRVRLGLELVTRLRS